MFVKLAVLACVACVSQAVWNGPLAGGLPASQFPAGVSPQACPNYPNCANPAVAANPQQAAPYGAQQQWNAQPQWNAYNPAPVPQYNPGLQSALDRGDYTGDGDWRGEGLAESGALGNQGGWNGGNQGGWNGGNQGGWNGGNQQGAWNNGGWNQAAAAPAYNPGVPAQIPAGVDARSCPNYPFCHA